MNTPEERVDITVLADVQARRKLSGQKAISPQVDKGMRDKQGFGGRASRHAN